MAVSQCFFSLSSFLLRLGLPFLQYNHHIIKILSINCCATAIFTHCLFYIFLYIYIFLYWILKTYNILAMTLLNNYIIPVIQQIPIQSDTQKHPGSMPCSRACSPIYHQAKKHEPEPSKIPPQFPNSCPSTIWDPSHSPPQEEKFKIQLIPFPTSKNPTMHQQPREWTKEKKGKDRRKQQTTMQKNKIKKEYI